MPIKRLKLVLVVFVFSYRNTCCVCVCVCVCVFFGSLEPTLSFSEISFTCLGEVSKKVFRGCPCRVKCQLTYPYFSTDIIWVL